MATLVLQAVGGFAGGLFGPVGAAIGSAVGAMAGYGVDTAIINSTRRIEGPRLASAKPMTAEEGASLAFVYGTVRVAGTLIWATRFEEDKTTERQGGKGGPKVTTYSYFANAAFAVAQGEISGIRRIWADGKELDLTNIEMRVYCGGQNQPPDPLIEARQGQGNTPAYRNTAYVVFERLPLDSFGNRLPQLQFEVIRAKGYVAQNTVAIALLPGATEFGLHPDLVSDEPWPGEKRLINRNALHGASDWHASMDELQAICPHLKHVAIIVPWFGDDLRASHCQIRPGVTALEARRPSLEWQVENVERHDAHLISRSGPGSAYGGTPCDESVIRAIEDARARGLKVTLYPFIMMDVAQDNALPSPYGQNVQPPYPWRGRMTCMPAQNMLATPDKTSAAALQVEQFVHGEWGYRRFLLHCAELCRAAGGVDAFILGSELRGLTQIRSSRTDFPFVNALCALAEEVRDRLGTTCKLTYAADWSEYFGYHPTDGSNDVFFHLDPLWAHPAIDAVGIDNYMPLSDWRDQDMVTANPDGFSGAYDLDGLEGQIAHGEGYDWYYASDSERVARMRSPISDGAAGKSWVFRYKDLKSWWQNRHFNRIGGVEQNSPTPWQPMSKPFWLTELGCPAVDKGPNQPNVFPDAKSSENATPYFSNGSRSDLAMDRFLRAHLRYWNRNGNHNPISPHYGGPMLDRERIYLWAWDTRPFPQFPLLSDVWGDSENWRLGHWLNGRVSGMAVDELIKQIHSDMGLPPSESRMADGYVSGFIIPDPISARGALEPLLDVFNIHAFERDGVMNFQSASRFSASTPVSEDIVYPERDEPLTLVLADRDDLPEMVELYHQDPLRDYQARGAEARRENAEGQGQAVLSINAVMDDGQAQMLAAQWLERRWATRREARFALPWSYAALHVGDRIRLQVAQGMRDYIVSSVEDGEIRQVNAVAVAPTISFADHGRLPPPPTKAPIDTKPLTHFMDLPLWPGVEKPEQQLRVASHAKPWRGVVAFSSPQNDGFEQRGFISKRAIMGELVTAFEPGISGRLNKNATLDVVLYSGELQSKPLLQVLNGANSAAVLSSLGEWEILQFCDAVEVAPSHWRLSGLLRGQLGTDRAACETKLLGAPFVVLDDAVVPAGLRPTETGLLLNWRAGTAGRPFSADYFEDFSMVGGLAALRPLSPVHLRHQWLPDGSLNFCWIRRSRVDADDWMAEDVALGEAREAYHVRLMRDDRVIMEDEVEAPCWKLSEEVVDAWKEPSVRQWTLCVSMISAKTGRGHEAQRSFEI